MQKSEGHLLFSPSDIVCFVNGSFASWMDRYNCEFPGLVSRDTGDATNELLQKKGYDHESQSFEKMKAEFGEFVDLSKVPRTDRFERTKNAMASGTPLIFQAALRKGDFQGFADFLVRVPGKSVLGEYHYEPWDTKLSRSPKSSFALQLCCYAEMLAEMQGTLPKRFTVVLGDNSRRDFRVDDFYYYYLSVRNAFESFHAAFDKDKQPVPENHEDLGDWSEIGELILEKLDHLSLVANITTLQIKKLEAFGIRTTAQLAEADPGKVPSKLDRVIYARLICQAQLQRRSKGKPKPLYEVLDHLPNVRRGLAMVAPESDFDIFFDMEGYPLVEGGLEYLFGASFAERGRLSFKDWWAHNSIQERTAFEAFVDWAYARWKSDPKMHIYHYGDYEVSAIRRLASRYGTREFEVDEFLRNNVLVNLYNVVRHGIRIGEPRYSIKNIEKIYGQARESGVKAATDSIVEYAKWIEQQDGADYTTSVILKAIRDYNRADCDSTKSLVDWLRGEQKKLGIAYVEAALPSVETDSGSEHPNEKLADDLLKHVPLDGIYTEDQRVIKLIADLLGFYRREAKPVWWNFFDKLEGHTEIELVDDSECLALIQRTDKAQTPVKRSVIFEFEFDPDQETKVELGSICKFHHDSSLSGEVVKFDQEEGKLEIKFGPSTFERLKGLPGVTTLIPFKLITTDALADAIFGIATDLNAKLPTLTLPPHLKDFLLRLSPLCEGRSRGEALIREGHELVEEACKIALGLKCSSLCLQGPPGAGKTYTAANMIAQLLRAGHRVGITSTGHKAINLLLTEAKAKATERSINVNGWKIQSEKDDAFFSSSGLKRAGSGAEFFGSDEKFNLVGGTAWAFSAPGAVGRLDYLVVDEASQFSLANLVASSRCANNLILLGDQMQLEQPTKGSHPGESGLSCLQYFIQEKATIPPELGIFLSETHRLHPDVCSFISGAVYDGRLRSHPKAATRSLKFAPIESALIRKSSGLVFVPVEHDGNSNSSDEEVEMVVRLVKELSGHEFIDENGKSQPVSVDNILFVAPYNAQRIKLSKALGPGARVGTVDLFQGQEAPIVMLSMCSSSVDASPRGAEFLFSRNRINVAVSRAKCLAIIVGNPGLRLTRAATLEKMSLVNLFCRMIVEGSQGAKR